MVLHKIIEWAYNKGWVGNPKFNCSKCNYYFYDKKSRDEHERKDH